MGDIVVIICNGKWSTVKSSNTQKLTVSLPPRAEKVSNIDISLTEFQSMSLKITVPTCNRRSLVVCRPVSLSTIPSKHCESNHHRSDTDTNIGVKCRCSCYFV